MKNYSVIMKHADDIFSRIGKIQYVTKRNLEQIKGKKVIHFGSGDTEKSNHKYIESLAEKTISIDIDPHYKTTYDSIDDAIKNEKDSYDFLVCEHVLEHIKLDKIPEIFSSIKPLLSDGAKVIVTVPNINNFGSFFSNYDHINFAPPLHIAAIIETEGYFCNDIIMWSKKKHIERQKKLSLIDVHISRFLEEEYGLQLGRYVTIELTKKQ